MIEKARFSTDENTVEIYMPIAKFDEQNRTVSGFATLDNIDQQADVLTAEASEQAFSTFRGNIREQHDKFAAVGKMLSFSKKDYYDESTGEIYSGIYVTARVSAGAPNTWEKVLDGTLSGFSVKGAIIKQHTEYVPDVERVVRFVDQYVLEELSLVDSPCNQLANIMSIQKSADGSVIIKGMAAEAEIENVFWCDEDKIASITKEESSECSHCNMEMKNIGWFESFNGQTKEDKVSKLNNILKISNKITKNDSDLHVTEGGFDMQKDKVENNDVVNAKDVVKSVDSVETEQVEKSVDVEEVTEVRAENDTDLENIAKALAEIQVSLTKAFENDEAKDAAIVQIRESVDTVSKGIEVRFEELLGQHEALTKEFKEFKDGLNTVEKRLNVVESSSAIKKSVDVELGNKIEKSNKETGFWSGNFTPNFDQ